MKPIIRVENLSKQYRIGAARQRHDTLRDALASTAKAAFSRLRARDSADENMIWALKDVSFEVQPGAVVGIMGRNGAGKSTLLKVLSRITEPTEGEAQIYGRVASLLEVGTGFHGELTGRENIYLNGAILGMSRAEIAEKFDEIVSFAEVETFIDTPVKRYSSGMYLRLAFAVAAHLEPEILIVDEVLAVGDQSFRNKCLRKMGEIAKTGRTILFVSHDITAITHLCTEAILLSQGRVVARGETSKVITEYRMSLVRANKQNLLERTDRKGEGGIKLAGLQVYNSAGESTDTVISGEDIEIAIDYIAEKKFSLIEFAIAFYTISGAPLFHCCMNQDTGPVPLTPGRGRVVCRIKSIPLAQGRYTINAAAQWGVMFDWVECASVVNVETIDFFGNGHKLPEGHSPFLIKSEWRTAEHNASARIIEACANKDL